ncbi:MAG TPA: hypothetical protein VNM22_21055 [Candidatus Limnocylindrales bacterium]|nr:hypothetical protein [Candidatus Limnocylindrales bacterium]
MDLRATFPCSGFFTLAVLIGMVSFPLQAFSEEFFLFEAPKLSVQEPRPRITLNLSQLYISPEPKPVHLTLLNGEEISNLLSENGPKIPRDYCLLYAAGSPIDLLKTVCSPQSTLPALLGEKGQMISPLEKNLSAPSEPAWGIVSSKAFMNLGISSDLALELYLAEDNMPTLLTEDVTKQLAFFDGLRSRLLEGMPDIAPFTIVKSKIADSTESSSGSSPSSRGLPIVPLFKWNSVGLALKWKW